jgi:hypothetical protein
LGATFGELINEMPRLLAWGRDEWLTACGLEKGEEGWSLFRIYAAEMMAHTSDTGLLPLIKRATETEDGRAALESVLAFIAGRPPRTWIDADVDRFQVQAKLLGKSFRMVREETAPEISLSPKQREDSRQVTENIRKYIQKSFPDDPIVLKAALQALLKDFNKKFDE